MIRLPFKSVHVGGLEIPLRVDLEICDWGQYDTDVPEIRFSVRAMQNMKTFTDTLYHEMLHAALDLGGISYSTTYCEESVVRCLEHIFRPAWRIVENNLQS